MEFSNQYLSYEEYEGLGGTIDLMPFNLLEFECRRKIDSRTQNRLRNVETSEIPKEVKLCMFKMIQTVSSYDKKIETINSNAIKSENIDGYSVTYSSDSEIEKILVDKERETEDIIYEYLYGVIVNGEHILYLGVE